VIGEVIMNKDYAWSFFDGACQGPKHFCSLGFVLFTSEDHYFTGKENLGIGTNNQGEFKALLFLLKCALEKNILQLQVFGDSTMTINWMNNEIQVHSTGLSQSGITFEGYLWSFSDD
jgi:ribonuclease HI